LRATYQQIRDEFDKWLIMKDKDVLDVVGGSVLATRLPGNPIYLALVSPPSSGKSVVIESLNGLNNVYPMGKLTPQTFISGYKKKNGKTGGLLEELSGPDAWILTFKDFTTVLQMHPVDRGKIMADLREIYDGSFRGRYGTGEKVVWKGKVGLIVGCTGFWDQVVGQLSTLGERFILYRMPATDPEITAEKSMREEDKNLQMEAALEKVMQLLDTIPTIKAPSISYDVRVHLSALCKFTAHLRTAVPRSSYTREVVGMPELEGTGRLARQFSQLLRGITLLRGLEEPGDAEVRIIERVAIGSLPPARSRVLEALPLAGETIRRLGEDTGIPKSVLGRTLQDLALLGIVKQREGGFHPVEEYKGFFLTAKAILGRNNDDDDD
jgi:hypothetical protein